MKRHLILLCIMMLTTLSLSITAAQDNETEAYDVIRQAIDALGDGYTYSSDIMVTQTFIGDGDGFGNVTSQSTKGQIDADGNYHIKQSFQAGETSETLEDTPIFHMELLSLVDSLYIYFENVEEAFPTIFEDLEAGWYSVDDLMASFDELSPEQLIIQNLTTVNLPADDLMTDDFILSVEELESTTIDGVDMRVFEVEMDAFQIFIAQNSGTGTFMEQLEAILESGEFLEQSEFTLTYTLWIGADDGLWYGGESTGYTKLAYLSAGQAGPPYDIVTDITSEVTITEHGAVETITLPEALE